MKNTVRKLTTLITLSTLMSAGLLTTTAAKADGSDNTEQITNGISSAISLSDINAMNSFFHATVDQSPAYSLWVLNLITSNANQAAIQSSNVIPNQAAKLGTGYILTSTTAPSAGKSGSIPSFPNLPWLFSPGYYASLVPVTRTAFGLDKSAYLSSGSLLAPTKYSSNQQANASVFIQFLSDAGNKVQPIDAQTLNTGDPSTVATYLNTLANYNAGQSVGLNALLTQYNERVPLPQLNGESALSYDQQQVLKRMQPAWTASVSKMTVVDVARETLYTQAEMNYQIFELRMQLEQLNTTLAAMQMQQQQLQGKPYLKAVKQEVQQSINAANSSNQN